MAIMTGSKSIHVSVHPFYQISQFGINTKFPCVCAPNPPASGTFQVSLASKLTDQGTPTITLTGVYTPLIQASAKHRYRGLILGSSVHSVAWIPVAQRLAQGQLVKGLLMIDDPSRQINMCRKEKSKLLARSWYFNDLIVCNFMQDCVLSVLLVSRKC